MTLLTDSKLLHDGFTQKLMKRSNTRLLFNLIRSRMPISRAALAKETGLSPTTVSILVDEMLQSRWIHEVGTGGQPERGRRPILIEVNAPRGYVVIIDIFSGGYKCALYDLCLNNAGSTRVRKNIFTSLDICGTINDLLRAKRIAQYRLLGIHIIFPGLFDASSGRLRLSVVIPAEEMIYTDLVEVLSERFKKSIVMISNNGGVIAYSEFTDPDAKTEVPLLSINIDEGISGGMVLSEDRSGTRMCFPLEIGHIIVEKHGPACRCGNHGCLEAVCSTPALFRSINEHTGLKLAFRDSYMVDENQEAMDQVARQFQAGNPEVRIVMEEYVFTLCSGLISVVNLCGIKYIHIGGAISSLGPGFTELVCKTLREHFVPLNADLDVSLALSPNNFEKNRRSAALMTLDEIFNL